MFRFKLDRTGIAKEYQGIRDTYLLTERVYGHEDIIAWLERQMKEEPEKTHTLLVPQFLLSTVQPIVNRMVEEGRKIEVVNVSSKGWGNVPSDLLGSIKTVHTNFVNGKFSLQTIRDQVLRQYNQDLFRDRKVLAVGQGLWSDDDLRKELAISILSIEFKKGTPIWKFVKNILKKSGMNEKDMQFLLDRLSKPTTPPAVLEKLASQEHEIKSVATSQ